MNTQLNVAIDANNAGVMSGLSRSVSWGAIIAGATGACALSLLLLILGVGLGLSSVSPWGGTGMPAKMLGWSTIGWLTFSQLVAAGFGGYLAGRLRGRWVALVNDEVFFRDTAHGFLAWAVSTVAVAACLSTTVSAILSAGAPYATSSLHAVARNDNAETASSDYWIGSLLRTDSPTDTVLEGRTRRDFTETWQTNLLQGQWNTDDRRYLAQLIAKHTGLPLAEADQRLERTFDRARQTIDEARRATAYASLWFFVALLLGAFIASYAATRGGRQRDSFL